MPRAPFGRGVLHLDIREGVGAALVADKKRIALRVVARPRSVLEDPKPTRVGILAVACRDALGDDRTPRVLADVDHLGARVGC